jgi:toxin ParE1/3/4
VIVRWLKTARNNRFEQLDYIAADNPTAAARVDEEIERQTDLLAQFPKMGREGRVNGTRELVINRSPYIVVYRVKEDRIEIIRLLHGAQRWPKPATPKAPASSSSS